jgi:hypothetical protein
MTTQRRSIPSITLANLAERSAILIGIDTEYHGAHTLTIQTACRIKPEMISVQIYRSPAIKKPPSTFNISSYVPTTQDAYGRFADQVVFRDVLPIESSLSPALILGDLFAIPRITPCSRHEGRQRLDQAVTPDLPYNADRNPRTRQWRVPTIHVVFVGHFLRADLAHIFGSEFYESLLRPGPGHGEALTIRDGKLLRFVGTGPSAAYAPPTVEYAEGRDGSLYRIVMETRDTMLPFGPASLDRFSKTFLSLGKCNTISPSDKEDMLWTFRLKPAESYGYAAADSINTLLIDERMREQDREIYRSFGFEEDKIPPMKPTLGSRVGTFLVQSIQRTTADSVELATSSRVKTLMKKGGVAQFQSRYGNQTGQAHGGLNFSRTPTIFWHEAPDMFRDVDMSGCYNHIIEDLAVYCGRPVVYEPGRRSLTSREAVDLVEKHADPDAWYIRVTGDLSTGLNVLIPSTADAVTSANFGRKRLQQETSGSARLYTRRIESGIVTQATWLIIQALPNELRHEYERLTADSIVFYPRRLVAADGPSFDRLITEHRGGLLPWESELDLDALKQEVVEHLDDAYVTLKYPIGACARRIGEFRAEARRRDGKDSGTDIAWKYQANTMYGVLACEHMATNNAVAANQITATGRAKAYALMLTTNGFQVITDGCTYRRDQIPACTLAECLRKQPDFLVRRAEKDSGIPFLDPASIPDNDSGITTWFAEHALAFFEVGGESYKTFFGKHELVHKTFQNGAAGFDALACDGSANHLKCRRSNHGEWQTLEMKMRGYGPDSKEALRGWIVETYSNDRVTTMPPVTKDRNLLGLKEAQQKVRTALSRGLVDVIFPLGVASSKIRCHRAIKLSAFLFQTPEQRRLIEKQVQKFERKTGCGLEVLALRRGYRGRSSASLREVTESIFAYIQAGGRDLTKHLHLKRPSRTLEETSEARRDQVARLRASAEEDLLAKIDAENIDPNFLLAAIHCTAADRHLHD